MSESYKIIKAKAKSKKYSLIVIQDDRIKKTINFGARGMSDYTIHKDPNRKEHYIKRHKRNNEKWGDSINNFKTAGYLSKNILWNLPTISESIKNIENRLNISIKNKIQ